MYFTVIFVTRNLIMNKILTFLFVIVLSLSAKAQNKITTDTFTVRGNCGSCKERIEETVHKIKGIKDVSWNKETELLTVTYNKAKTNLTAIENAIAAAGHDTPNVKATDLVYNELPGCCAYRTTKCNSEK